MLTQGYTYPIIILLFMFVCLFVCLLSCYRSIKGNLTTLFSSRNPKNTSNSNSSSKRSRCWSMATGPMSTSTSGLWERRTRKRVANQKRRHPSRRGESRPLKRQKTLLLSWQHFPQLQRVAAIYRPLKKHILSKVFKWLKWVPKVIHKKKHLIFN